MGLVVSNGTMALIGSEITMKSVLTNNDWAGWRENGGPYRLLFSREERGKEEGISLEICLPVYIYLQNNSLDK